MKDYTKMKKKTLLNTWSWSKPYKVENTETNLKVLEINTQLIFYLVFFK